MVDRAEIRVLKGREAYVWDAETRCGGDIDRLVVKSEGKGHFGGSLDGADVQALRSRAIGPYFDAQAGVRQASGPGPSPKQAVLGFEGIAHFWLLEEGALFLWDKGHVTAGMEDRYNTQITHRPNQQQKAENETA